MLLVTNKLNVYYGNIQALYNISLEIEKGEIVTLIGANGAGKTTFMRTVAGILKAKSGNIKFENNFIEKIEPHERFHMGISLVSQERDLFGGMTVEENLELGNMRIMGTNEGKRILNEIYNFFPILYERKKQKASSLSGGEQQMLAIGRALMSGPKFLLLDEPSTGLAPIIVEGLGDIIKKIKKEKNLSILLAEQNAFLALGLSDRGYILENGYLIKGAKSSELAKDGLVKRAYLGI